MTYKIEQIVLENSNGFVISIGINKYEMYEIGFTHSTRCGQFSGKNMSVADVKKNWFIPRFGEPNITDKS